MKKKYALYILLPPVIQSLLYFVAKLFEGNPHIVHSIFDDKIPFIPYFVYLYCIWYLLLVGAPYIIYKFHKCNIVKYSKWFFINSIICFLIFIIYPTTVIRSNIEVNSFTTWIISIIYFFDNPPLNCFPSLHALNSMMWLIFIGFDKKIPSYLRIIVSIISVGIIISTLCIKQHAIYDLVGSMVVLSLGYVILLIVNKIKKK